MLADVWKIEAERCFPELKEQFPDWKNPYALWIELNNVFQNAYDSGDEELIRRIYGYADWCLSQPRGETADDDLLSCVAVCFYEHIPLHKAARDDMPRWFKLAEFLGMESTFRYHLSDEEFEQLKRRFLSFGNPSSRGGC